MPSRSRTAAGPLIAGTIIIIAIAVAIVVFIAAGATPGTIWQSFFPIDGAAPVTDRGHATRQLYDIVFYIAAAIFIAVEGVIIFTAFRYRRKPGDDELPPQTHGNNLVEVIWTAIPLAIVLFLFVASWQTLQTVDAKSATGSTYVRAVAARFQWKFQYLDGPDTITQGATPPKVIYEQLLPVGEDGGLVLPVGEPVHISLSSPDVIHAFYVPKFLFKRDVVPGKLNEFDFTIDTPGTYRGQCAELCGPFHGSMLFEVHGLPKADYDAWLAAAIANAPPPPPSGEPGASGQPPAGPVVQEIAKNVQFVNKDLTAPHDQTFAIEFDNQDEGQPHNIEIKNDGGNVMFKGELVTGVAKATYQVPALPAGVYPFVCTVHANMTGTITVK